MTEVKTYIVGYNKLTEQLGFECEIPIADIEVLRRIFGTWEQDLELFNTYPIRFREGEELQKIFKVNFDWETYDYFLERLSG